MAMGKRKPRQEALFVTADQIAPSAGHPFYQKLNQLLSEARFDRWIESRCAPFYEQTETRGHADSATLVDSLAAAQINLEAAGSAAEIEEAAADKGYHAAETIELAEAMTVKTDIPEPKRKYKSKWQDKVPGLENAVNNNRRRVRRAKGQAMQRRRSEVCERTFAHICDSGGAQPEPSPRPGECDKALSARGRRAQSGPDPADADRRREAESTARVRQRACAGDDAVVSPENSLAGLAVAMELPAQADGDDRDQRRLSPRGRMKRSETSLRQRADRP